MHDRIDTGTLRSVAEQSGARDFDAFCVERPAQLTGRPLIVIIVGLFRIDRTTVCGRIGKSLQ
jgi:hypothetical protein